MAETLSDRWAKLKKKFSRPKNQKKALQTIFGVLLAVAFFMFEVGNRGIEVKMFSEEDALCEQETEDMSDVMREVASEARTTLQSDSENDIKEDAYGVWLLTIDQNIKGLTAEDVANFNKFINCSTKYNWLHSENVLTYWIESSPNEEKAHSAHSTVSGKPHHGGKGGKRLHRGPRRNVAHGDIRRVKMNINGSEHRWELVFNDHICAKGGNPHICQFEKDAAVVYRARIQTPYPWFGSFRLGHISAAVVPSAAGNILRTVISLGGSDARFFSTSLTARSVNLIVTPVLRWYKFNAGFIGAVYEHFAEELGVSAAIMDYLYEPIAG